MRTKKNKQKNTHQKNKQTNKQIKHIAATFQHHMGQKENS